MLSTQRKRRSNLFRVGMISVTLGDGSGRRYLIRQYAPAVGSTSALLPVRSKWACSVFRWASSAYFFWLSPLAVAQAFLVDLVLVAVDQIRIGIRVQLGRDHIQGVLADLIVMIHERNEIASRDLQRAVRAGGDMAAHFTEHYFDPWVLRPVLM